jgi:hypothetical protein
LKTAKNTEKTKATRKLSKTPPPLSKHRGVRLKGPRDVVRLLGRLINEVLTADEENQFKAESRLRVVAYALTNMLKAYEVSDLQERISKIEECIECQSKRKSAK